MAYERVNWENLPSTNTPVNADNLNKMDEGIANIDTKINAKQDKLIAGTGIEITDKNTINNIQGNYSSNEQVIGKWDNKPLYRKYFFISALPNNTYRDYNVSVNNLEYVKKLSGMAYTNTDFIPIPDVSADSFIRLGAFGKSTSSIVLRIQTASNRSDMRGIIIMEYTSIQK